MTLEPGRIPTPNPLTSSLAETPAKSTVPPLVPVDQALRAARISSSALLRNFAHALFCGKTHRMSERTLPGLGLDFEPLLSPLGTLSCPSDSGRVALGRSTKETGCSCSVIIPTPTASDWRGGKRKRKKGSQANLRDVYTQATGLLYGHPEEWEVVAGFPTTWTECEESETQSTQQSVNG